MNVRSIANFNITCPCCQADIEFDSTDIQRNNVFCVRFIKCPVCNDTIYLDEI